MAKQRNEEFVKEAKERMKMLHIMAQPIHEFVKEGKLNLSEGPGLLYWLDEEEQKMVDDFESTNDALVYHVIKTLYEECTMYSLFFVSQYKEEWEMERLSIEEGVPFVYVVNKEFPEFSEFGSISVKPNIGGLARMY